MLRMMRMPRYYRFEFVLKAGRWKEERWKGGLVVKDLAWSVED